MHLALVAGDGEHLVAAKLDGARLVAGDVTSLSSNDALVGRKQHVDHRRVGLRAAHQKKHVGIGGLTGLANKVLGTLGVRIGAVAGLRLHIGVDERLQHRRMGAVGIVVVKREHDNPLLPGIGQMIQTGLLYAVGIGNARGKALKCQHQGKAAAHVTQKVRSDHDAAKSDERRNHSGSQKTTRRRDGLSLKAAAGSPASIRPIAACAVCPLANDLKPSLITPAAI